MLYQSEILIAEGEAEIKSKEKITHLDSNCDEDEVEVEVVVGDVLRPEEKEDEEEKQEHFRHYKEHLLDGLVPEYVLRKEEEVVYYEYKDNTVFDVRVVFVDKVEKYHDQPHPRVVEELHPLLECVLFRLL